MDECELRAHQAVVVHGDREARLPGGQEGQEGVEDPQVGVHHLWSALPYQIGKRADHPRIGDGRVEWLLRIDLIRFTDPYARPRGKRRGSRSASTN
jgi:hypothetical protein